MNYCEILSALSGLSGPAGFEGPVAQRAVELMAPLMDEAYVDSFGNAVGIRRCGVSGAKTVLLDAHLDEIGLMVTGAEEGFLTFCSIGGVDPRMLPNRTLAVLVQPPIQGVVTCLPPHLKHGNGDAAISIDELYVDIGFDQAKAEALVPIGTPMAFTGDAAPLGGRQLCGKAMDDRSCFAALLRAVWLLRDRPLDVNLIILGSTREEIGGAGAQTATYGLAPDCCIAVDVTFGRQPDTKKEGTFPLGGGPAIGVGPNMTRWITDRLRAKAEDRGIPSQIEVMAGDTGTNAWWMQPARGGIATGILSLPLKYMHTPVEVMELTDAEHTAALLAAFVEQLGQEGKWGQC